jgi:adenosylcobinamide-GDP ribazoletransferase
MSKLSDFWKQCLLEYKKLLAAAGFLSVIVLPGSRRFLGKADLVAGSEYFPLVGVLLALALGLCVLVLAPLVSQLVVAAVLVVGLVILTGGLHLDGLMDSCDGLFGGRTIERKLEIMRDSRVGSFGVLAGACALLLKFALLSSLNERALPLILLVVLPASRWTLVLALYLFPGARTSGLGVTFRQRITARTLALASAISLLLALVLAQFTGLLVWLSITITACLVGIWLTRKLGGLTGDTCGAIAEIVEIIGLLAFLLLRF